MQPVQLWVILTLGRVIACWSNVLSPPVPEKPTHLMSHGSMCFLHSAGQELLASPNLNIHKSRESTLGSVPNLMKHIGSAHHCPPLRYLRGFANIVRITFSFSLSLSLSPFLFLPPSRFVRQIREQLIKEFNARIHAHIMGQLEKEPQLQGRSYNLEGHLSCAECELLLWMCVAACLSYPGCHLSPLLKCWSRHLQLTKERHSITPGSVGHSQVAENVGVPFHLMGSAVATCVSL